MTIPTAFSRSPSHYIPFAIPYTLRSSITATYMIVCGQLEFNHIYIMRVIHELPEPLLFESPPPPLTTTSGFGVVLWGCDEDGDWLAPCDPCISFCGSSLGVGGASFRGGIRSLMASRPFASANEAILWLGENPCNAFVSDVLPPDKAPSGSAPVGVKPFNCSTDSDSSLER